jgi:hypothetical protein
MKGDILCERKTLEENFSYSSIYVQFSIIHIYSLFSLSLSFKFLWDLKDLSNLLGLSSKKK